MCGYAREQHMGLHCLLVLRSVTKIQILWETPALLLLYQFEEGALKLHSVDPREKCNHAGEVCGGQRKTDHPRSQMSLPSSQGMVPIHLGGWLSPGSLGFPPLGFAQGMRILFILVTLAPCPALGTL